MVQELKGSDGGLLRMNGPSLPIPQHGSRTAKKIRRFPGGASVRRRWLAGAASLEQDGEGLFRTRHGRKAPVEASAHVLATQYVSGIEWAS